MAKYSKPDSKPSGTKQGSKPKGTVKMGGPGKIQRVEPKRRKTRNINLEV